MSKVSLQQSDTGALSAKKSTGTIPSTAPSEARIKPPLNRYAHMHGTLAVSLILTTLVSLGLFVMSIIVRHFTVDFVGYIFENRIRSILEENKKAMNMTWADEHFPPVLERGDWGFDADDWDAQYIGRWSLVTQMRLGYERPIKSFESISAGVYPHPCCVNPLTARLDFRARLFTDLGLTNVMLLWAASIAGLICFFHKADAVVASFIFLNMVSMLGIILTTLALTVPNKTLSRGIEQDLVGVLQKEYRFYSDNMISRLLNTVMIVGKCCGISGPQDFGVRRIQSKKPPNGLVVNETEEDHHDDHDDYNDLHDMEKAQFLDLHHHHVFQEIPMACCHRDSWMIFDKVQDQVVCVGLGISHDNDMLFRNGCYSTYASMFVEEVGPYIFGIAIIVCIEQIIQMFVGIVVLRWSTFVDHQTIIEKGVLITTSRITRYTLSSVPGSQT